MSKVNYATMTDQELKQYFLCHPDDRIALQTYLDRISDRPHNVITTVDDPDFETKMQIAFLKQMQNT
jgi:hypothetical protein